MNNPNIREKSLCVYDQQELERMQSVKGMIENAIAVAEQITNEDTANTLKDALTEHVTAMEQFEEENERR